MPPKHISLVGAGNGKGVWVQWLVQQTQARVTLVEADTQQCATLQRTLELLGQQAQHCEVLNTVVAAQPGRASFFLASNQKESSLLDPLSLQSLWPNLQTEEVKELSAITLDALLGDLGEDVEQPMGEGHWLVIDCLPAGALLRASSKLDLVDVVIARVLLGEPQSVPAGASLEEVAELLQQNGMVQVAVDSTRHPGIGYALFVRDARAALHAQVQKHHSECQKLRLNTQEQAKLLEESRAKTEQLVQAKLVVEQQSQERLQKLEQLSKMCDEQAKLVRERQVQIEQLTQAKAAVDKQLQERVQQLAKERDAQAKSATECQAQIEQLTQAKAVAEKQALQKYEALEKQLKEFQLQNSLEERISKVLVNQIDVGAKAQLEAFSKILQSSDSVTKEALQGIVNASEVKVKRELGKGLANSVKQLESFMSIQSFFSKGEFFSDFHGWPISPDVGVFLLEKMRSKNYDLIIEFGSGTSTAIFAKAAEILNGGKRSAVAKTMKTEIVTFEHNEKYHGQTQKMLQARNLAGYVNLVLAPLVDWKDDSGDYLYYDSKAILQELSEKYSERKIKVLVLVDGPPGLTCTNARYPAVPVIFNTLSKHSIDIVLDDANRPEEKKVIELWESFWRKRSVEVEKYSIPAEKGVFFVEMNK